MGAVGATDCRGGTAVDRRLLPEHCLPAEQERNLEREGRASRITPPSLAPAPGAVATDMAKVRQSKRNMVEREIALHLENYKATGAELI
jgi:hypothetical protein